MADWLGQEERRRLTPEAFADIDAGTSLITKRWTIVSIPTSRTDSAPMQLKCTGKAPADLARLY
ncbi:hypothetical protein [Methylobacter sp.]|uniref:hypothetical protein n=1 Tax=Methylobacter sp. TaxID=2051955 RepID=UPI002487B5CA|nr:hypothetical protein [Methylobacter sp.]MDI1275931.1 hypothetical protein [Methylobacter sp.]MDI1356673.1 hypothetical protein [Methylobacter sp.]